MAITTPGLSAGQPPWEETGPPALLVLEDGAVFAGNAFAGQGEAAGEVVFNTGMTGYQEVLSDPSYRGQILMMTYPLIGSCGVNPEDMESAAIHAAGFVVREYQRVPSNWRARRTLQSFLEEHGRLGLEGIDTRAVTRHIRTRGALRGIISTRTQDVAALLAKVRAVPELEGRDLVREVTCRTPYTWPGGAPLAGLADIAVCDRGRLRVVVLDCGVKFQTLRNLAARGCEVIVVPAETGARAILDKAPHGVLLSNGPGDPAAVTYAVATVRELLGRLPIFGICMGHQILGRALGGRTAKLKFGHHGINQPVKNLVTGRVEITSQNHGFVVAAESLPPGAEVTHLNLNDATLEGLRCPGLDAFSIQYHPEAAPGPSDSAYLFDDFVALMRRRCAQGPAAGPAEPEATR